MIGKTAETYPYSVTTQDGRKYLLAWCQFLLQGACEEWQLTGHSQPTASVSCLLANI